MNLDAATIFCSQMWSLWDKLLFFIFLMDFFENSYFSTCKIKIFKLKLLPRLAIFGGFDYMVSISMKNRSFDVFCGWCIFAHLSLQTSFFWLWKMAGFCMIHFLRICRFMAKKSPKYFSCSILFCHFAKLSIPKTQLCYDMTCLCGKLVRCAVSR